MKMGRVIEGSWKCSYCGSENPGLQRECKNCGRPKGADVDFDLNGTHRRVLSATEAKEALKGPDWFCECCDTYNKAGDDTCAGCGSPKGMSRKDYFTIKAEREKKVIQEKAVRQPQKEPEPMHGADGSPKGDGMGRLKVFLIVAASALAFGLSVFGLAKLLAPKPDTITVTGTQWEYAINISKEETVKDSGWELPIGARLLYSQEEQRGEKKVIEHYEPGTETRTRKVLDHIEEDVVVDHISLGNGAFQEVLDDVPVYVEEEYEVEVEIPVYTMEPVMDTRYYYEVDKWVHSRSITTSGTDKQPYWGEYELEAKEREGSRTEKYTVTAYGSEGVEKTYRVDHEYWLMMEPGDVFDVLVHFDGSIDILDSDGNVIPKD